MAAGDTRAARRYASALFRVALKTNLQDETRANLHALTEALANPAVSRALNNPRVPLEKKQQVMHSMLAGSGEGLEHFVNLLSERNRLDLLPSVARSFGRLVDEHNRVADGEAVSAVPLSADQVTALTARLEATTGYKVRLKTRVDESIIGGLVVRVGDQLFDGSVAGQLRAMRDALKKARVSA
jgi:F-type H+-transporting ATPase subunit delta